VSSSDEVTSTSSSSGAICPPKMLLGSRYKIFAPPYPISSSRMSCLCRRGEML
jgi:hypothetical protein